MARAVLAPEAAADLDEIWLYIAEQSGSADVADRLVDRVTALFLHIAGEPYMGRRRDDLRTGMRSFRIGRYRVFYRVFYRVADDAVVILRVLHGRRDIDALFSRPDAASLRGCLMPHPPPSKPAPSPAATARAAPSTA